MEMFCKMEKHTEKIQKNSVKKKKNFWQNLLKKKIPDKICKITDLFYSVCQ